MDDKNLCLKTIYADLLGQVGSRMRQLLEHPPAGYRFLSRKEWANEALDFSMRVGPVWEIRRRLNRFIPTNLFISYGPMRFVKPPRGVDLTYSESPLVFRAEPWVVGVEVATQFAGYNYHQLRRWRKTVERVLASPHCRAIICWSEAAKRSILSGLDTGKFHHKLHVVYPAGLPKGFAKPSRPNGGPIRILFVGSGITSFRFTIKGGPESLEAFAALRQRYPSVELIVRCDVEQKVRQRYEGMPGLRIVPGWIPGEQLQELYRQADIFWYPAHSLHSLVELEAMSYELPVVATDYYDNAEFVEDGRTGMVIPHHRSLPPWDTSELEVQEALRTRDDAFLRALIDKTTLLIEDPELRQRMGRAAREEVERGKFSLEEKNRKLKAVFDQATTPASAQEQLLFCNAVG